jgi:hypothetical protein
MRTVLLASILVAAGCQGEVDTGDGPPGDGGSALHDGAMNVKNDGGTMKKPDMTMTCTPSCGGKMCGADGCGGMCGSCPQSQICNNAGMCVSPGPDGITVDVGSSGGSIHPEIYGLAFADPTTLTQLNIPLNRWGGNSTTRYNWMLDVHNVGSDYFFENIADTGSGTYGQNNYVSTADSFVTANNGAKSLTLMTIPSIGWTPKDRVPNHPFTCGYPVSKYGAQQSADPYDTNCGNGVDQGGKNITGDPANTSIAAPPSFETSWLTHLVGKFGNAGGGGIAFYQMDNEMMLWDSTHRDVHPMPVTYDEVWQTTSTYGPVIKAADPTATLLGYTSWGVLDLFESGLDTKNQNNNDQKNHGGLPLAKWYLSQLASYEKMNGSRLVDCLDLHYYPMGGSSLDNTRSLWDPTYHDPSWIDGFLGEPIQLFPRLQQWIAAEYPGTGICVSEYNFDLGNETDPKTALAEADVLGIYGKYGVRLGAYWTTPVDDKKNLLPPAYAFALYRNYDGANGTFGSESVAAATTQANVTVYAATDQGASLLTVVVINKGNAPLATTLGIMNFSPAATAKAYQYVAQNGGKLAKVADAPIAAGKLTVNVPALSMTMFAVPKM